MFWDGSPAGRGPKHHRRYARPQRPVGRSVRGLGNQGFTIRSATAHRGMNPQRILSTVAWLDAGTGAEEVRTDEDQRCRTLQVMHDGWDRRPTWPRGGTPGLPA